MEAKKTKTAARKSEPTPKATDKPMKLVGEPRSDLMDLVRESSSEETLKALAEHQSARILVDALTVMRCVKDVTQVELAERMKCVQSKVSKMESSIDADLNFGDIVKYAHALGQSVRLWISPAKTNGMDRIRHHAESIKREVSRLIKLAGDDKAICDGVEAATLNIVLNMVQVIEESLQTLPGREQAQDKATVSVDVAGESGTRLPLDDGPKRARRSGGKKANPAGCA